MRKINRTGEKSPPLPVDKPATYENENKRTSKHETVGNRDVKKEQPDKDAVKNPQKEREKLEYDPTKREKDPGMTKM